MPPYQITPRVFFVEALANDRPKAMAWVVDNRNNPKTSGLVKFYQPSNGGVLVEAEVFGLPENRPGITSSFFAMHIHNADNCSNVMSSTGGNMMSSTSSMMSPNSGNMMPSTSSSMMPSTSSNMMPSTSSNMMPSTGNNNSSSSNTANMMPGNNNNMVSGNGMNNMMGHFNPGGMSHPFHAGDFPPLLSNQGYAWMSFFDRRFTIDEIIGKTVVIHAKADDFTSQPSGNSGNPIACGEIRRTY